MSNRKDILIERATNMILKPTKAEMDFRNKLELKGIKYRAQVVISKYIVDFVVGKTIYEIDGSSHDGKEVYDSIRDLDLKSLGYKVIHIQNKDVLGYKIGYTKQSKGVKISTTEVYVPTPLEQIRLDKQKAPKKKKPNKPTSKFKSKGLGVYW
jgi:very-short-patch-repair endonuclease